MLYVLVQIMAAFLATLGGLLISSDFIGTVRLNRVDSRLKSGLDDLAFRRWDYFTSIVGYGTLLWGKIGLAMTVMLVAILCGVHYLWMPLPLVLIAVGYLLTVVLLVFVGAKMPYWTDGLRFFLLVPLMSLPFLIELFVVYPVLRVHWLAKDYELPSLVKLSGALCICLGFLIFIFSFLFSHGISDVDHRDRGQPPHRDEAPRQTHAGSTGCGGACCPALRAQAERPLSFRHDSATFFTET